MTTWICTALLFFIPSQNPKQPPQDAPERQDPFRPSEALLEALRGERSTGRSDDDFRVLQTVPKLPEMHLRGVLRMKDKPAPAAVLELEGQGFYVVHEHEDVAFTLSWSHVVASSPLPPNTAANALKGSNAASVEDIRPPTLRNEQTPIVLRVQEIRHEGVKVQIGTLGEVFIIR